MVRLPSVIRWRFWAFCETNSAAPGFATQPLRFVVGRRAAKPAAVPEAEENPGAAAVGGRFLSGNRSPFWGVPWDKLGFLGTCCSKMDVLGLEPKSKGNRVACVKKYISDFSPVGFKYWVLTSVGVGPWEQKAQTQPDLTNLGFPLLAVWS